MTKREVINEIHTQKSEYKHLSQAEDMANSLDTISDDIYSESKRFIYELIQNADDSAHTGQSSLEIKIEFTDNFVVLSHNGKAFSPEDIKALSSVGKSQKSEDPNQTGYKGIGFKSVFGKSDCVYISSDGYCFRYDKDKWLDAGSRMPWQIIPIWSDEEVPSELGDTYFGEMPVSTAIKFSPSKGFSRQELKEILVELFSNSQIMLFLRNVNKISLDSDFEIQRTQEILIDEGRFKLRDVSLSANQKNKKWLVGDFIGIELDAKIKAELKNDDKAPKRLQQTQFTNISFAASVNERGNLEDIKGDSLIFTYLPTKITKRFPFLVNADFLTNAPREGFHEDSKWNIWLFEQIGYKSIEWLRELGGTKYKHQFIHVIADKFAAHRAMEKAFDKGHSQAIDEIAFIPNLHGDLLRVKDTIYDKTRIAEFINPQILITYINQRERKQLTTASFIPYLPSIGTLAKLGMEIFDVDNLDDFFASPIFRQKHQLSENFRLISFLYEQSQRNSSKEGKNSWDEKLKNTAFIFDETENLQKPAHIYFPSDTLIEFPDEIKFVHEATVADLDENTPVKKWLENLGVEEPSDISFIEKNIIGWQAAPVTTENAVAVGQYLFNAHNKHILTDSHYNQLHNLNILTKEGSLIAAKDAFLSDIFEPELKLEKVCKIDIFTSENYCKKTDSKREWGTFFVKIGVNQNVDWREEIIDRKSLQSSYPEYFELLPSGKPYNGYQNDFFEYRFWRMTLMEYATEYSFATEYWAVLFESSINPDRVRYSFGVHYAGFMGNWSIPLEVDFHDWALKNMRIFPTTQKKCLEAQSVYSSSIPHVFEIAGGYLPVFDCGKAIPPQWKPYLEFRNVLGLDEYLSILSAIWQDGSVDNQDEKERKDRIILIYSKLLEIVPSLHPLEKRKIRQWSASNKLLSNNGIDFFYPYELSIVSVEGFRASNLAYTGKNSHEVAELLRLFGARIIDNVTAYISNGTVEISGLKTKLEQISPLLALVATEKTKAQNGWSDEYERIRRQLAKIRFFQTSEIYITYGDGTDKQQRSTWAEDDDFYYVGNWTSARVIDGLVEPLCTLLNIKGNERILTVLLSEKFSEGLEYLKEKGIDTSIIPIRFLNPSEVDSSSTNRAHNTSDADLGRQGELAVFEKLKEIYRNRYGLNVEETHTGFRVGNHVEVWWRSKNEASAENHDFKVIEMGRVIYIESKATSYADDVEKLSLYISRSELRLMTQSEKYLIARVYNATSRNPSITFIRMHVDAV